MTKHKKSRGSRPPEIRVSSEAIAESSNRPGGVRRFLGKAKNVVKKISRSKDSRSSNHVLPPVDHERASSTPNLKVPVAASGVEQDPDPQTAIRDAKEAAKGMNSLSGRVKSVASTGQNASAALDNADNFQNTYLQPLKIFDSVIGNIADVHPYAKMALGVLSCASKIILAQVGRDEAVQRLVDKLDEVYSFMTQDQTLRHISAMHSILGQISQQTLQCAHFIRDYSETKSFWKRSGKNIISETDGTIQQYNNVLDKLMQNFRDQTLRDVAIFIHRTGEILDLGSMTCAEGAGLDTGKQCLPGTRAEILSEITNWVNSTGDDVPRVLWLSGPAGTGKSAIAHTIANWSNDVGGLGSCYCFDRQREADHRHEKIFTTIARDLADHDPEMRRALAEVVQNASALKNTPDIVQQWQKLLVEPLAKLSGSTAGPVVVVIDALDESGGVETRRRLLPILSGRQAVPNITELPANLRIIVTSRPLRDIEKELGGSQHIRRISMDGIPLELAERDIHAYVSKKLEGLSDFGSGEFAAVAKKSEGMFEWARLACDIIEEPPPGLSPIESFNALMSRNPTDREHLLYDMYNFILTEIMLNHKHPNAASQRTQLARFHSVMGQILGAAEPLPLNSMNVMRSHFPDESEHYKVEVVIEYMGSLLGGTNASTPIRPLHASFRDFLTDQSCSGDFFVDVSKVQHDLAIASLRVMEHGLRFNICHLTSSYLPNSEDPGLRERLKEHIPPHLSYSCRFWPVHVQETDLNAELAKEVKVFFNHERLFFWLEVLGLTQALSGAVAALPHIAQWLKKHSEYEDASSTAMDVQRFIQVFGGIILHSTPHLYVSALPFLPINSAVSQKIAAKFTNTLRLASGRDANWHACQTVLTGHTGRINSVSFSPDGTRIATGSKDKTVRLWDAATGQPVGEPLLGHTGGVTSVSFSPDSTRIVSGSRDYTVRLWDAATGQPVGEPLRGHTSIVTAVSFSPDGTHIVTGSWDRTVRLWDAATGKPVGQPLQGHTEPVTSVAFSPDGTHIATGSWDKTVRLWDTSTGQLVGQPLYGHSDLVSSVSFSPDGTCIVTGSNDYTVRLWDAVIGECIGEPLWGHTNVVQSVSFSPDGTCIASGACDNTVRLWNVATGQPVGQPLQGHTGWINSISFSPDGTRIVSGSNDTTVRLWDAATGQPVSEPIAEQSMLFSSVSLSPDGTRIVTGCQDHTVRLWDAVTGQPVGEPLQGHTDVVRSLSFSPDGTRIVSGSDDTTIRLWDAATGQPLGEPLRGHTGSVCSVLFSSDGTRIVSGSYDNTIRLWDVATGQPVGEPLRGHTGWVWSVSFSLDGTRIVSGSYDKTIRLWDAATGQPVGEPLQGHTSGVSSVTFSRDGTRIVSGSHDDTIRLWDAATGQPVGEPFRGNTSSVLSVSFSSDGTRIVSGSDDKTIRLWDAATGQPVGEPLQGHTDWVSLVSFSRDGTRIVSCSDDGTVRVWYAVVGQPLQKCAEKDHSKFSEKGYTTHPTEASTTTTTTTSNDDFIRFSSNATHSLADTAQLLEGTSHDDRKLTPFLLGDDGWMLGPNGRLLFWVPPASRKPFYTPWTALVLPRGVELDLSCMAHGTRWQHCRDEPR